MYQQILSNDNYYLDVSTANLAAIEFGYILAIRIIWYKLGKDSFDEIKFCTFNSIFVIFNLFNLFLFCGNVNKEWMKRNVK